MAASESIATRAFGKLQRLLAKRGYEIVRRRPDDPGGFGQNVEVTALKLAERLARFDAGGFFETPEERALSQAVARFVGEAKRIVCLGPGTGVFEHFAAVDAALDILGLVPDADLLDWCQTHRVAANLEFTSLAPARVLEEYGSFDLALAIDVIDGTENFSDSLRQLTRLSERAVVTVTNRARSHEALISPRPIDPHHVREWTAGELYWVLRGFYGVVELYGMPDPHVPQLERAGLFSEMSPLIAVCEQ
ncbi:MAG: hypothetical protein JRG89_11920 [Deltaproteobacteria bacterium]|nr:hypothetical protein [Deltaproteobacteria bacterium]